MVEGIPGNIMDTYCWIHSTFSIPERFAGLQGHDIAHPGVAPVKMNGKEPVYHKYYQWVCFVLFFQAGLFYVPRYLWKATEGGRVNMLAAVSINFISITIIVIRTIIIVIRIIIIFI